MSRVVIVRSWSDESLQVSVEVDGQHPDLLDQATTRTARLYADALEASGITDVDVHIEADDGPG